MDVHLGRLVVREERLRSMSRHRFLIMAVAAVAVVVTALAQQTTATPAIKSPDPDTWVNERGVIDSARLPERLPISVPYTVWEGGIGYVAAKALYPFAPGYQASFDGPYPVFEGEGGGRVIAWYFRSLDEPVAVATVDS